MRYCTVPGCSGMHAAKGLCRQHYDAARRPPSPFGRSRWVNPLICVCDVPVVTGQGYGQCQTCFRPPLAGFRSLRSAS